MIRGSSLFFMGAPSQNVRYVDTALTKRNKFSAAASAVIIDTVEKLSLLLGVNEKFLSAIATFNVRWKIIDYLEV